MSVPPLSERVYRRLLRLYPAEFRREYGERMLEAFRSQRSEERYRTPLLGGVRFWVEIGWDLAVSAARTRWGGNEGREPAGPGDPGPARIPRRGGEGSMGMTGSLWHDVRTAARSLRRSPGFTAVAVLTLGLGIGAATAIFAVVNGVVLKPLPYGSPGEVVTIWSRWTDFPDGTWVSRAEYRYYVQESRTLRGIGLWFDASATFTDPENPERVSAASVTPNLFEVLRVRPALGRTFTEEEARDDAPVLLLSHDVWQRRFGGDPGVVGRRIDVDGERMEVLGVLPAGFRLSTDYAEGETTDLYAPMYVDTSGPVEMPRNGGSHSWYAAARLAEGVSPEEAGRELSNLVDRQERRGVYPPEMEFDARVVPVEDDVLGTARTTLWILLGAVGVVLLVACGNVANLVLVRSGQRGRELAVRAALGAGRLRILRHVVAETALVALGAGALGLGLAAVGVDALLALDPAAIPRAGSVALDPAVFAFALGVSAVAVGLVSLLPARRALRGDAGDSLRASPRGGAEGSGGSRTRGLLVAAQLAMAVVLLLGAGLMGRTLLNLVRIDPGFEPGEVLTLRVTTPPAAYPDMAAIHGFYDQLLERVRALPGVRSAAAVRSLPLANEIGDSGVDVDGYTPGPGEYERADWQVVSEDYFETMGIPLLRGRTFRRADGPDADLLVINETMARRYWQGRDPLGTRVTALGDTTIVVGVVGDIAHNGITSPVKTKMYRLQRQLPEAWRGAARSMTLTVATAGPARSVLPAARAEIRRLDPRMALSRVRSMEEVMAGTVARSRFTVLLLGAFAAVAVVLTVVGIYGVISYAVTRRSREIGIRLALGARRGEVVGRVLGRGMLMAVAGVAAGSAVAWAGSRALEGLLYQVEPNDPATFAAVAAGTLALALAASWLPARRVSGIDPARSLRAE